MMQVDLEKCEGCGECLEVCPVDAISFVRGPAFIDPDTCLVCEACAQACPHGAISETRLSVPVTLQNNQPETAILTSQAESTFAWAIPLLSYVGREILPRLADTFVLAIERRLLEPPALGVRSGQGNMYLIEKRQRQNRRRCRGKKF